MTGRTCCCYKFPGLGIERAATSTGLKTNSGVELKLKCHTGDESLSLCVVFPDCPALCPRDQAGDESLCVVLAMSGQVGEEL